MLSERSSRALAGIRFPLVLMVLAMHVHPEALHAGPVFSPAALALWVTVVWLADAPFVQQFQQLFYLAASFATLSLAYALSVREPSPLALRLSESSFFVYALHMVTFGSFSMLGGIDSLLASLLSAGTSAFGAWCYMFIAPAAVASACFLLFMLLRRLCPSVLAVLTGGRLSSRR